METATSLRRARSRAGLTVREVASLAGTSAAAISTYERGRVRPRVDVLERVAGVLGLDLRLEPQPANAADRLVHLLASHVADMLEADPAQFRDARRLAHDATGDHADAWRHVVDGGLAVTIAVLRSADPIVQPLLSDCPLLLLVQEEDRLELVRQAHG
ncbi:MAG: helix-turn-helix domain-containing protein [Actinomycetes bacterium]